MSPIPFDNSYARLPDRFYTRLPPTPVAQPGPLQVNHPLASQLGIDCDWLDSPAGTGALAALSTTGACDTVPVASRGVAQLLPGGCGSMLTSSW